MSVLLIKMYFYRFFKFESHAYSGLESYGRYVRINGSSFWIVDRASKAGIGISFGTFRGVPPFMNIHDAYTGVLIGLTGG